MAPPTKSRKVPGYMRQILKANLDALIKNHREFANHRNQNMALAKAAQVSLSTIQRIRAAEVGASLDVIEQLANVFDISVYQITLPNLDPDNPQVVAGATAAEKRWYTSMKPMQAKTRPETP